MSCNLKGENMIYLKDGNQIKSIREFFDLLTKVNKLRTDLTTNQKKTHSQVAFALAFGVSESNYSAKKIKTFGTTDYIYNTLNRSNIIPQQFSLKKDFINKLNNYIRVVESSGDQIEAHFYNNLTNFYNHGFYKEYIINILEYLQPDCMYLDYIADYVNECKQKCKWVDSSNMHFLHSISDRIISEFEGETIIEGISLKEMYINLEFMQVKGKPKNCKVSLQDFLIDWGTGNECFDLDYMHSNMILVLGEPGHGKSSLCKKIAYDYLQNENLLNGKKLLLVNLIEMDPNVLKNKSYSKGTELLEEIIRISDVTNEVEDIYNSLIFLDGYDELHIGLNEIGISTIDFFDALEDELHFVNKNIKIVTTSRKSCINTDLINNIPIVEIADLSLDKQLEWISCYRKYYSKDLYDENKLREIHKNKNHVKELIGIPILFQLIVHLNYVPEKESKASIYNNLFNEIVLKRTYSLNRRKHKATKKFKNNDVFNLLENIAYNIFKHNDRYSCIHDDSFRNISELDLGKIVNSFYFKSEKFHFNQIVEFSHRSFYQFFLSRYLYKKISSIKTKQEIAELNYSFSHRILDKLVLEFLNDLHLLKYKQKQKFYLQDSSTGIDINEILYELDDHIPTYIQGKNLRENISDYETMFKNCISVVSSFIDESKNFNEKSKLLLSEFLGNYSTIAWNLKKISLSDTDLKQSNWDQVSFSNSDMRNVNMSNSLILDSVFKNTDLSDSKFSKSFIRSTEFAQVDCLNSNFNGSKIINCNFVSTQLSNTKFNGTDTNSCEFKNIKSKSFVANESYFTRVSFLRNNISEGSLKNSLFRDSTFNRYIATSSDLYKSRFLKCKFNSTKIEKSNLRNSEFFSCQMEDISLNTSNLNNANFRNSNLRNADLTHCNIVGTDFSYCDLRGIRYKGLEFNKSNLIGAKVHANFAMYLCNIKGYDVNYRFIRPSKNNRKNYSRFLQTIQYLDFYDLNEKDDSTRNQDNISNDDLKWAQENSIDLIITRWSYQSNRDILTHVSYYND